MAATVDLRPSPVLRPIGARKLIDGALPERLAYDLLLEGCGTCVAVPFLPGTRPHPSLGAFPPRPCGI
jgi:hypothetical protein